MACVCACVRARVCVRVGLSWQQADQSYEVVHCHWPQREQISQEESVTGVTELKKKKERKKKREGDGRQ